MGIHLEASCFTVQFHASVGRACGEKKRAAFELSEILRTIEVVPQFCLQANTVENLRNFVDVICPDSVKHNKIHGLDLNPTLARLLATEAGAFWLG
jgi:hypothetical protein